MTAPDPTPDSGAVVVTRPLRGAALTAARNTRPLPATSAVARPPGQAALPQTLHDLLHTPGVHVAPDEQRQTVVLILPLDLAWTLAEHCPDPLQAQLACHLISSYEDIP